MDAAAAAAAPALYNVSRIQGRQLPDNERGLLVWYEIWD